MDAPNDCQYLMDQKQISISTSQDFSDHEEDVLNQAFLASSSNNSFFSIYEQNSPSFSILQEISSIPYHQGESNFYSPPSNIHITPTRSQLSLLLRKKVENPWMKRKEKISNLVQCKIPKRLQKQLKKEEKMVQRQQAQDKQWLKKLLQQIDQMEYS